MNSQDSRTPRRGTETSSRAGKAQRAPDYVGRNDAVKQLLASLSARRGFQSKLLIQSVEGPGGIGKTALFEHVLAQVDRTALNTLTMRVSGSQGGDRDPFQLVHALVASCDAPVKVAKPLAQRFTNTEEVRAVYGQLTDSAKRELQRAMPDVPIDKLMQLLRFSVECGQRLNTLSPESKKYVDFDRAEQNLPRIEDTLRSLKPLMDELPSVLEKLGVTKSVALRNAVRANALNALADAFVSDLTALLAGYEKKHLLRPAQARVPGLDRLLLVLDDYEALAPHFGEFLVGHLVPKLKQCAFESVLVVIGRDQLALTHPSWSQHHQRNLADPIALAPLSRKEMDALVRAHGRTDARELDRAWNDTMGYPLLVTLWLDEAREVGGDEGPSIGMLKRFHDRTTHWLTPEQRRWLYHALFLSKVNAETFAATLGDDDEGRRAFHWFEGDGSVRDAQGRSFRVRPYVRSRLADYLEATDPALFRNLRASGEAEAHP